MSLDNEGALGKPKESKEWARVNLVIPPGLAESLRGTAEMRGLTPTDLARHLLKIGLETVRTAEDSKLGVWFGQEDGSQIKMRFIL